MKRKNIIAELKNSLEVFNNRLDYGEEIISKLKDRPFEIIHYCWRSKFFFLSEESLGTYGTPSSGLIYIKEVTEEERKGIRLFKETMAQNFQLRKHTKFDSQ